MRRWSEHQHRASITTPPDMCGFFLNRSALNEHGGMWEWECPWCGHSIAFTSRDRPVAESAARVHVLSSHGIRLWDDVIGALHTLRASHGWVPGGDDE